VQTALKRAVQDLPPTWRDVVIARDVQRDDASEVGRRLGLTPRQERAVLNRARAMLRASLDRQLEEDRDR
jgi:DNA-directed RNA polymerase specialized sigma24 family protein